MIETELTRKSRDYAMTALSCLNENLSFHCFSHTEEVVHAAEEIGKQSSLSDRDLETVIIAAWFHDTGYQKGHYQHEEVSAGIAEEHLKKWGLEESRITQVKQAIEATRMPQVPKSFLDKVLCDADLFHLSTEDAEKQAGRLRKEFAATKNLTFSDDEWNEFNLRFLKGHHYFTPYGQTILEDRKKKVIKKLKKNIKPEVDKNYVKDLEKELEKLYKKLDKKSNPERGIETMFRIASENHITLSGMADTKANIMISINSIILSVVVTVLFRKLEEFPNLLIPTLMIVTVGLVTIVFAVLATRPHITDGKFTKEDIKAKKTNLLFFGNFHGMELSNFDWGMREMMKDSDYLYGSLIKDIYFNGKVLAKKYRYLRLSYSFFMFGFVASIIAFLIAMLLFYYPTGKLPI